MAALETIGGGAVGIGLSVATRELEGQTQIVGQRPSYLIGPSMLALSLIAEMGGVTPRNLRDPLRDMSLGASAASVGMFVSDHAR